MFRLKLFLFFIFFSFGSATMLSAANPDKIILERQDNFKDIKDTFKALGNSFKNKAPLEKSLAIAKDLHSYAIKSATLFPASSKTPQSVESDALPIIWEDSNDFKKKSDSFVDAVNGLVSSLEDGDNMEIVELTQKIGANCKACHKVYRN